MIIEPPDATGEIIRMLRMKLSGRVLWDVDGRKVCSLAPAASEDWTFDQYLPKSAATLWRSVTPVVLHGFNTDGRGRISVSKTERLLLRAFEMAGYGERLIARFAFQAGPLWPATKHSSAMRVPKHLDGYPRIQVEVRFREGVRGPVLAGIGRHYGIGLFAKAAEV
jgi:CRISPR-associated protein Csb2